MTDDFHGPGYHFGALHDRPPESAYRDMVIGRGKIRHLHWWNRWYWRRKAIRMPDASVKGEWLWWRDGEGFAG